MGRLSRGWVKTPEIEVYVRVHIGWMKRGESDGMVSGTVVVENGSDQKEHMKRNTDRNHLI